MTNKQRYVSCLGEITILTNEVSVLGVWFENQKYFGGNYNLEEAQEQDTLLLQKTKNWLDLYFKGMNPNIEVSLLPEGTFFQQEVWEMLKEIPYGKSYTYGEIAHILQEKKSP